MRERAMTHLQQASVRNHLLSTITRDDFGSIQPHLEPVTLAMRQMLFEPNAPMEHPYFPEQGITSVLANTSEGRIEVGLIGREGMVGVPVLLGVDRSPHAFLVQAPGY